MTAQLAYALSLASSSIVLLSPRSGVVGRRLLTASAAFMALVGLILSVQGQTARGVWEVYTNWPLGTRLGFVGASLLIATLMVWALLPPAALWRVPDTSAATSPVGRARYIAPLLGFVVVALLLVIVGAGMWEIHHEALMSMKPHTHSIDPT